MTFSQVLCMGSFALVQFGAGFECLSDIELGPMTFDERKGLVADKYSWDHCSKQLLETWPNTPNPVLSIQLPEVGQVGRSGDQERDANLEEYLKKTGAQVMVGVQLSCSEVGTEQNWNGTKSLLQRLQPFQVMGLVIGNELEQLHADSSLSADVKTECIAKFWEQGHLWNTFTQIVSEFDHLGFSTIPVSSAFTTVALDGAPFYEVAGKARVNSFLMNASSTYRERFALTLNVDPFSDPNMHLDANSTDQCSDALIVANCWEATCMAPTAMRNARLKMQNLPAIHKLWIGKIGWSTHAYAAETNISQTCRDWHSLHAFQQFYQGFLQWDLQIGGGQLPPDHVFFSAMRGWPVSHGYGRYPPRLGSTLTGGGLVRSCNEPRCKIASEQYTPWRFVRLTGHGARCKDASLFDGSTYRQQSCEHKCVLDKRCKWYNFFYYPSVSGYGRCVLSSTCNEMVIEGTWKFAVYQRMPLEKQCSFVNEPTFPSYFWDPACLLGHLGCYADGMHVECRFCGGGDYASIPCPTQSGQPGNAGSLRGFAAAEAAARR